MTRRETSTQINPVDQSVLNLFNTRDQITDEQIRGELNRVGKVDTKNCKKQVQDVVDRLGLKPVYRGGFTFYIQSKP